MGQTCALLGSADPRLNAFGAIDLRLSRQVRSYRRVDAPPTRVKPIPITLLQYAAENTRTESNPSPLILACADMMIIGFYFLMRSGEYAVANAESHPFRLADIELYVGAHRLDINTAPLAVLRTATFVILCFTTQKNAVRGEKIGHGRSGIPFFCPVAALVRRIVHLRTHGASTITPVNTVYTITRGVAHASALTTRAMTAYLRRFVAIRGDHYGLRPGDIEARSLRSSGAMALLCAQIDTDLIQLVGRWRSDSMLRYLHVQAAPIMSPLASAMTQGGDFTFHPLDPQPPALN